MCETVKKTVKSRLWLSYRAGGIGAWKACLMFRTQIPLTGNIFPTKSIVTGRLSEKVSVGI
jgi:hypothetical protein